MRDSATDLTELVENAHCGLIIFSNDSKTSLIYANEYYYSLFGYTAEEYTEKYGFCFSSCIHPEDSQKFKSILARQYAMGTTLHFECRAFKKNNSLVWILIRGKLHIDSDGTSSYYCSCLDITDIKSSYNDLAKAKLELDIIADSLTGGIIKININTFELLYANNGFYKLSGFSRTEYEEKYRNICLGVLHPDDIPMIRQRLKESVDNRSTLSLEYRIIHKSGQVRWSYLNGRQIEELNGSPVYLCVIVDITTMKQYEEQLMEDQKKQKLLCDFTNEISWELELSTNTLVRSGKTEITYSGLTEIPDFENTILAFDVIHPDDINKFRNVFQSLKNGRTYLNDYLRIKNNIGRYIWYLLQGVTLYDEKGLPCRIIGKTTAIAGENSAAESSLTEVPEDVLTEFLSRIEMAAYINEILENQDGSQQSALFTVSLQADNLALDNYQTFFSNTLINEAALKISRHFPSAQKSYFGQGEFIIFIPFFDSTNDLDEKKDSLDQDLSSAYIVESGTIQISIGFSIATMEDRTFGQLYNRAAESSSVNPEDARIPAPMHNAPDTVPSSSVQPAHDSCRELQFIKEMMDLLDDAGSSPSILRLVLSKICNYYDADQVCIIENTIDNQFSVVTYDWQIPGAGIQSEPLLTYPCKQTASYETLFNKDGIFYCNDFSVIREVCPVVYEGLARTSVRSMLQCAFYENGCYFGFLSIHDSRGFHSWNSCEIKFFQVLAKLVESVLIRARQKQRITSSQFHDPVTGLLSFSQFIEETNQMLKTDKHFALLCIDINKFKSFNTKYGFSMGNKILNILAKSIRIHLNTDELCSRINGDQFAVLMSYQDMDSLNARMAGFNNFLSRQRSEVSESYCFTLSTGIYLLKSGDTDITDVIDKANYARKSVKQMPGVCNYMIYSSDMDKKNRTDKELTAALGTAFTNHEFIPYYQPKYKLNTEELCAAEALARWKRPGLGILSPRDFIHLLEETRHIVELDFMMIEEVCRKIYQWMKYDKKVIPVSVNISGAHLNTADFIERLMRIVNKYQVPVRYLGLEFTESLFIKEPEPLTFLLDELTRLGFPITLDNFGDEYSSLNLLKRFPIHAIKLNASYFHDKLNSKKNRIIFRKIVEMAKELGITVHAQNVETTLQADFLKEIGCDVVQGYLYHKAMSEEDFEKYIL